MTRKYLPHFIIIFLMVITAFALAYTVDITLVDEPGVRMVLPTQLGDWTGNMLKYCHNPECKHQVHIRVSQ